ncbi:hypothetical protein ACWDYJ_19995 [Streptomyces sp. NPDC003042]
MSVPVASRSRRLATATVTAGVLAAGLLLAPEVSAVGSSAPTAPRAKAVPCEYVNGEGVAGTRLNATPPRWKYGNSPYLGTRFDRCGDVVTIHYGGYPKASYYKVAWSINCPKGSFEKKYGPGKAFKLVLTAAHCRTTQDSYTTYEVQVAACTRHTPPAKDTCTRWSPRVLLTYFTNP